MERHRRRVGQIDPVGGKDLETRVFALGMASVRLEHHTDRRKPIAIRVGQRHTELHEKLQPGCFERLARSHRGIARRPRAKRHQMTGGCDLALQGGAIQGELQIGRALLAKDRDDAVTSEIRRVRHRRPPVAFDASRVLCEQFRVLSHEVQHGCSDRHARWHPSSGTRGQGAPSWGARSCARAPAVHRPALRSPVSHRPRDARTCQWRRYRHAAEHAAVPRPRDRAHRDWDGRESGVRPFQSAVYSLPVDRRPQTADRRPKTGAYPRARRA